MITYRNSKKLSKVDATSTDEAIIKVLQQSNFKGRFETVILITKSWKKNIKISDSVDRMNVAMPH